MKKLNFSTLFALQFLLIGVVVGIFISMNATSEDYRFFYIYSGTSGFITAWLTSYFLIERPNKPTDARFVLTTVIVGLLSHWLCWYLIEIELNIRYYLLNEYFYEPPMNLLTSLYGAFAFCLWSWMFFGWATGLGAALTLFSTKMIKRRTNKQTV
jgi:hypothetical protein